MRSIISGSGGRHVRRSTLTNVDPDRQTTKKKNCLFQDVSLFMDSGRMILSHRAMGAGSLPSWLRRCISIGLRYAILVELSESFARWFLPKTNILVREVAKPAKHPRLKYCLPLWSSHRVSVETWHKRRETSSLPGSLAERLRLASVGKAT